MRDFVLDAGVAMSASRLLDSKGIREATDDRSLSVDGAASLGKNDRRIAGYGKDREAVVPRKAISFFEESPEFISFDRIRRRAKSGYVA